MFVKITNGQVEKCPYSIADLRKDNPQKSFPKEISTSILESCGIFPVVENAPPEIDVRTQMLSWSLELVNNSWRQVWSVSNLTPEKAEKNIRRHRNNLLANSDWTQIADSPVDQAAWATYRQALRDLPEQDGFPFDVQWPTLPNND